MWLAPRRLGPHRQPGRRLRQRRHHPQEPRRGQRLLESAEAYKQRKINEAQGDASRFTQVAAEYAKAGQVNGHRLYLETMEQILPRIKKLIVDKSGNLEPDHHPQRRAPRARRAKRKLNRRPFGSGIGSPNSFACQSTGGWLAGRWPELPPA